MLCSIYVSDCFRCENTSVCVECNGGSFLEGGRCVGMCASGYYEKKGSDVGGVTVAHCHACSANCTQCFN